MPKINIPTGQASQASQILQRLMEAMMSTVPCPIKDAHKVARVLVRLQRNEDLVAAETARVAAVKKHGTDLGAQAREKVAELEKKVSELDFAVRNSRAFASIFGTSQEGEPTEDQIASLRKSLQRELAQQQAIAASGQVAVMPENFAAFSAEIASIMTATVELDVPPIPVAVLELTLKPPLQGSELLALEPFLEGE
jgi:hypothetical protein